MTSDSSFRIRFVIFAALCSFLLFANETVAQQSLSLGCGALQNAQQFSVPRGARTGMYPSERGEFFYQGDTIGATWPAGVKMRFQVWKIGTDPKTDPDRVVGYLENNKGTVSAKLAYPNGYYAVELINTDPTNDASPVTWTCTPKPAPQINQAYNFNATVSVAITDKQRNVTGQLSGVLHIDDGGNLVGTSLTLNMPYAGENGVFSSSTCNFQDGVNDGSRTVFIFDSSVCLYYSQPQSSFGVRVYLNTSAPLTSPSAQLTAASMFGNSGVGGD
ncbi:MAG: hypothetical protein ACJ72H_16320 [Candidatus Sulfotelmatobacter sp.]